MIPSVEPRRPNRRRLFRDCALLLVAAVLALGGTLLARLDRSQGPQVQRVNIRWAPAVSAEDRARIERETGLHSGHELNPGTWSYLLRDRSAAAIARLVRDPRIEDTFHLDPRALKVTLDRPDLDPRLRTLLETDHAGTIALALQLAAVALVVVARHALMLFALLLARTIIREARWVAREVWPMATAQFSALFDPARDSTVPGRREMAAGVGLSIMFLVPLLLYGPFEDEIVQATIMPNQVFYRALFHGQWLYWLNNLGFGSPMPLGDPLMFHPVFGPLAAFTSLRVTLSAVWIAHSVLMAVYLLRLMAVSGITTPALRLAVLWLFFVSLQFGYYFYSSDWVQMAITWTLYPVLVFHLRAVLLGGAHARFWRSAALLGLLFGFWVINAHPGYIIPMTLVLAVYALATAPLERRVYICLAVGGALCIAIVAPRIYMLLHEVRLFPAAGAARDAGSPEMYIGAILTPLVRLRNRAPFIGMGAVLALLAVCFRRETVRNPHLRGCLAALVAAVAFNVMPQPLPAVGTYLFRDPITFFSLILAAYAFQQGIRHPRPIYRYAAFALVLVQVVQQTGLIAPSFAEVPSRGNFLLFYRYQEKPTGLARVLVDRAAQYGPRVLLSPVIDRTMRRDFSADGLHFSSDLVLHGLNPVNGWFKNVSMAVLYPPFMLMESTIGTDPDMMRNQSLLDVLGINLMLSTESENRPAPGLVVVDRPLVHRERLRHEVVLLANPTAWPRAVLLAPEAASLALPLREQCGHKAALCREFAPLARTRLEGDVALSTSAGRYVAQVPPADRERLLFFSTLYRPEWEATAGGSHLKVQPVAGAFLGVAVPPHVSNITVAYIPRTLIALNWLCGIVFFTLVGVLLLPFARRVARGRRAPEAAAA